MATATQKETLGFGDRLYTARVTGDSAQLQIFAEIAKSIDAEATCTAAQVELEKHKTDELKAAVRQFTDDEQAFKRAKSAIYAWYTRTGTILKGISAGHWTEMRKAASSYSAMYAVTARLIRPQRVTTSEGTAGVPRRAMKALGKTMTAATETQLIEVLLVAVDRLETLGTDWAERLAAAVINAVTAQTEGKQLRAAVKDLKELETTQTLDLSALLPVDAPPPVARRKPTVLAAP